MVYGMGTGLDPKLMDLNQRRKKKYCKQLIKKSFVPPDVHHYNKDFEQNNIWGHKELEFIKQKLFLPAGSRQMPFVNSGTELVITRPRSRVQMSLVLADVHHIDLKKISSYLHCITT